MSRIVLKAENVGKKYLIGHKTDGAGYTALRDVIAQNVRSVWNKTKDLAAGKPLIQGDTTEEVWAVKDLSFEVNRGESVGIIGRNGAGKSTLLKILSRITEPSIGRITIKGRVASLLEVGTGFHPELSGRENIFLNGTILGMARREIKQKFDQIVSFAEVEKYLDTPVKRYSSGMYVRLAFAVAAHLEPEILLVDEVLAVGDLAFQKKCLNKMGEISQEGRTVLFVSHNMAAIQALCSKAYLLDQGQLVCHGPTEGVVAQYMQRSSSASVIPLDQRTDRKGDGSVRLTSISIDAGTDATPVRCSDPLRVRIGYRSAKQLSKASVILGIYDQFGQPVFFLDSRTVGWQPEELPACGYVTCLTGPVNLTPGRCTINVAFMQRGIISDHLKNVCPFEIVPQDFHGTGKLPERSQSLCLLRHQWQAESDEPQTDQWNAARESQCSRF